MGRDCDFPRRDDSRRRRTGYEVVNRASQNGANLFSASVKHSYGVGLLLTLERAAPFRVDVGFSEEDVIVSAGFGLSF